MRQPELPPRNYSAILVNGVKQDGFEQDHNRLGRALLTGAVELEIHVLAPVHVGSGAYSLVDGRIAKATVHRHGEPVVPGTSIKGMCRQIHEVLTQSASPFNKDPPDKDSRPSASTALFGRLGFQGRVSFDDAVSNLPVHLQEIRLSVPYPPQKNVGRRFYGPMPTGASQPQQIPALTLPPGTKLTTVLRFRNVRTEELGAVLLSLGIDRFTPKIGGGKYDALGWVRFRPVRYRLRRGLTYRSTPWTSAPAEVTAFYTDVISNVRAHLTPAGRKALQYLENHMQAPDSEIGGKS